MLPCLQLQLYAYMFTTSVFFCLHVYNLCFFCLHVYNFCFFCLHVGLHCFCFQLLLHLLKTHKLVTYWQFKVCVLRYVCVIVIMVQEVNWNRQSESFTDQWKTSLFYVMSVKDSTFHVMSVKDFLCYYSNCTWKVWNKLKVKFVRLNKSTN